VPAVVRELNVRPLRVRDRGAALRHLDRASRLNLSLIDLVLRLGTSSRRGEGRAELLAAYRGRELVGVAALHPSMTLDATVGREVLEAFFPYLASVGSGLVKSGEEVVDPLWEWLRSQGRRALLDRIETGYALEARYARLVDAGRGGRVREARDEDLDLLVDAARASLREGSRGTRWGSGAGFGGGCPGPRWPKSARRCASSAMQMSSVSGDGSSRGSSTAGADWLRRGFRSCAGVPSPRLPITSSSRWSRATPPPRASTSGWAFGPLPGCGPSCSDSRWASGLIGESPVGYVGSSHTNSRGGRNGTAGR